MPAKLLLTRKFEVLHRNRTPLVVVLGFVHQPGERQILPSLFLAEGGRGGKHIIATKVTGF